MKRIFSLIVAGLLALSILTACEETAVCAHKGGIATCKSLAECSLCGDEYGSKNKEKHEGETSWVTNSNSHYTVYDCCEAVASEEAAHSWKVGVCQECLYACEHEGGTASCTTKATCEKCGALWGEKDEDAHTVEAQWICDGTTHKKLYTCCNTYCSTYENYLEAHVWQDGVCTECGYGCLHTGGRADCQTKAKCDICGSYYGELNSARHTKSLSWINTATGHTKIYSCCNTVVINNEPHVFWNYRCSALCGYFCNHSGGEATCINRAVCDNCGSAYGHLDPSNHANLYESDIDGEFSGYRCCGGYAVG